MALPRSATTEGIQEQRWKQQALSLLDTPVIVIDGQGRVVWANPAARTKLGVAPEQRWSDIQDLLPPDYVYRFHDLPADWPAELGDAGSFEFEGGPSGDDGAPGGEGAGRCIVIECFTKVDESAAEELARLREANEELESIFNSLFDEVFVTDGYGVTIRVNKAVEPIYGLTREELVGRAVFDLERDRVFYPSVTAMVLKERKRITALQTTRSGRRLIVTANPVFDANGEIVRVVSYTRDITEPEGADTAGQRAPSDAPGTTFVASDPVMQPVLAACRRVAATQATVLLLGETGVGKNRMARLIHSLSPRREGPFVEINCATIPESLFESELFGYESGAFTGARREGKPGKVELADGGTLFLNEIGEVPLHVQAKLLDLVQEHVITRVGGDRPRRVNIRIVAATNQDLAALVKERRFREDLYYRLNVVPITIPPLRQRPGDIPALTRSLLDHFAKLHGLAAKIVHPDTLACLLHHPFPGNIRELENLLERLTITVDEDVILPEHLPPEVLGAPSAQGGTPAAPGVTAGHQSPASDTAGSLETAGRRACDPSAGLRGQLEALEREIISAAARRCQSTYEMARLLQVSQSTVVRKLRQYGIRVSEEPNVTTGSTRT